MKKLSGLTVIRLPTLGVAATCDDLSRLTVIRLPTPGVATSCDEFHPGCLGFGGPRLEMQQVPMNHPGSLGHGCPHLEMQPVGMNYPCFLLRETIAHTRSGSPMCGNAHALTTSQRFAQCIFNLILHTFHPHICPPWVLLLDRHRGGRPT